MNLQATLRRCCGKGDANTIGRKLRAHRCREVIDRRRSHVCDFVRLEEGNGFSAFSGRAYSGREEEE